MNGQLDFGVLGPLAVSVGARRITVGGARQRTILALLLISPGRVVSVDAMVEAVWQGDPPATARTQVAICIAALRKIFKAEGFGEELISTDHPGYQLNPAGHRVDLLEFTGLVEGAERLAAAGRTAEAAEDFERALRLWRGPVLSGVTGRLVEEEAERLEELRLVTHDEAIALQLALGNHQELIGQLVPLVREHPLRERTRHSLMLAQYRAGRRAEALETFREGRRLLIGELGIEPGPALQELHDAILRDDPALTPAEPAAGAVAAEPPGGAGVAEAAQPRVAPSDLPPNIPSFTGRSAETRLLNDLLGERSDAQPPAIGFITGVAGVGKTGLAVHWAHRVAGQFPDGRLFVDLSGHDAVNEPAAPADVLSRFLRSLGVASEQIPAELADRVSLYRSMLADRRILVVLDNARSIAQITPLLPSNGQCCVLVTSRDPLEQLMLRYGAVRVQLGVLSPTAAIELLARIVPAERIVADPEQSARLSELCDRLPLALRIAAARLASKPHWTVRHLVTRLENERRRLDELSQGESQVRACLALSYRYLAPDAARLFRRLALLPVPDFTSWVGAALLDDDLFEAERLMEHLVDVQLLEGVGVDATGQLRYRFQSLLRLFAQERAQQEESAEEAAQAGDRAFRSWLAIAEQAHRREYGGDYAVIHGSSPRRPVDPVLLDELIATPLDWYEAERLSLIAVIEQAARLGRDELAWDLTGSVLVLFDIRGYLEDWQLCCERALAATRAAGNPRGSAFMLTELGASRIRAVRLEEAAGCLRSALELFEELGEEHGRALALRHLAVMQRLQGDLDGAGERLREAAVIFERVGDASSQAHALGYLAQNALDQGDADEAVRLGRESVRVSRGTGETRCAAQSLYRLARGYVVQGELRSAEQAFLEVERIVRAKGDLLGTAYVLLGLGEARVGLGLPGDAERDLMAALRIARRIDSPLAEGRVQLAIGQLHRDQARTAEARRHFERAQLLFTQIDSPPSRRRAEAALAELAV
ncbi:AfsR/SARP family transcriptional regulator [Kitasatospora mediocidica]|uniref:AfsR/SARP family transcriptional regulator n=1 Tax=Kitasatospora mediocidica TaxID=58352 RepID=UPI000A6B4D3A|nr:BTAD domain-containing putative transcriptional regulator [Kitasatospora mediocidica]